MAGVYQADKWCDECAQQIAKDLIARGEFPSYWTMKEKAIVTENEGATSGEVDVDSNDWPCWGYSDDEPADSPHHCAAGHECKNRIDLCEYGLTEEDTFHGAEERYVGALVSGLTSDGADDVAAMLSEKPTTPYQKALHRFWRQVFSDDLAHLDLTDANQD